MVPRGHAQRSGHGVRARALALAGLCLLTLLPFAWLIGRWAPTQLAWAAPSASMLAELSTWMFHPRCIPDLTGLPLLWLAGVGVVAGFARRRWRRETAMVTSWIVVLYLVLSMLSAKEARYAVILLAPLVVLCAIGALSLGDLLIGRLDDRSAVSRHLTMLVSIAFVGSQGLLATRSAVPEISGYRELVSFVERIAPEEPVFYDGFYDGIFTFYLRAGDSGFRRRVVLGNQLLYAFAIFPGYKQQDFVSSPEEVIQMLQEREGCRWLLIERSTRPLKLSPMRHLRDAVKTPAFELVRSFPIDAAEVERVDVYRLKLPVAEVSEVELPFPALGPEVKYRVRPISPRQAFPPPSESRGRADRG